MPRDFYVGERVRIEAIGTITKVSTGHGRCYTVRLDLRDFYPVARSVSVDEDEIFEVPQANKERQ